ncbi:hypothetical protein DXX93_04015 [Thalassotalea euphylliae]|uniref:Damage-inducible protein n=1 Tax=Thalassotalea euphylliae TaxID=1655234 RepID=A0A3E0TMP6_9GAMM|nr:YebG family protein [Thalassotalea euphylliae]REL25806.1 hypothetical protein DXX93_04015 [Thalassotalea euphylliae]
MAVESRFVVIRDGVEVQTFMDKKAADEYDKMLDMADNLSAMLSDAPIELSEQLIEDLSIFLAQRREEVLIALQAKKAKPAGKTLPSTDEAAPVKASGKAKTTSKAKAGSSAASEDETLPQAS